MNIDMSIPKVPRGGSENARIPVTVLTGFLGSGKTTLVNHVLTAEHGQRIAVIENEFGDVPIDNALVIGGDEKIIEMSNGCCLCCTARTDLIDILNTLRDRADQFDRIVIETSGMADPNPVAQTFFVDDDIAAHFRLDAIVTLVDAKHIEQHLDEVHTDGVGNQASDQIAFADRIVINKIDLVTAEDIERIEARLRTINQTAGILTSRHGRVDLDKILGIAAFNRNARTVGEQDWLHDDAHTHEPTLSSESITVDGEIRLDALRAWLDAHVAEHGDDLYRLKGILRVAGADLPHVVQGIHQLYDVLPVDLPHPERSTLVFIGRNLDRAALDAGLSACRAEGAVLVG